MNKKKVLMCYHSAEYGGVEKHIFDIIEGLSSDFDFYVACPAGPLVEEYIKAGAVKHIDIKPKFEADFGYVNSVRSIIKKENIEIVHAHELLSGTLATFAAWLAKAPKRIYHVHTSFTEWKYPLLKKYPALFLNTIVNYIVGNYLATDVIALTDSVKNTRVRREFINTKKIRVIPNGIDLNSFKYDIEGRNKIRNQYNLNSASIVIGNIARFTIEKGHKVLLDAFSSLVDENSDKDLHLLLAGDGSLKQEIISRANNLGLIERVHFTGKFNDNDKNQILSALDFYVFPSYAEGFGISLVEAMAMGLPCVVSKLNVLQDVAGNAVEFFETGNPMDLKDKLNQLLKDEITRQQLGDMAKYKANEFSMDKFWQAYRSLYNF